MSKIKFKLEKIGNLELRFQVLHQETWRALSTSKPLHFTASNGIKIASCDSPELKKLGQNPNGDIWLRGADVERDLESSIQGYKDEEDRNKMYDKILEALKEWSQAY